MPIVYCQKQISILTTSLLCLRLLRLQYDLLAEMEKSVFDALVAIDLSAAFDTVDHTILLSFINTQYGVRHTA